MRRLSIATTFRGALLGLTVVLAVIAAVGVAALYGSRQDYEDRLSRALQLQTAAGRVLAAGVVEEATLRLTPTASASSERRVRARDAYAQTLAAARTLAEGDAASVRLLAQAEAAQARLRRRPGARSAPLAAREPLVRLAARQDERIASARRQAKHDSRRAFTAILVGGGLAVLLAATLVAVLVGAMRRPLDRLVAASRRLAEGRPEARVRVPEDGPEELQALARSFNQMATRVEAAAERLEEERLRLDVTIRSLGDALVILDADGIVTSANPRAHVLVPELDIGVATDGPAATATLPVPLSVALATETPVERDGRTLAVTAAALDQAGGGHVLTVRDVSERARLERLKSEFVATASHELRSPLTSIKGFVELLSDTDGMTPRQREFLDIISVSTDRLVALVGDLLDVARVEAGAVEIQRRPTNLRDVVTEVTDLLRPRLAVRDQSLLVDVPDDLPRAVVDPARIRQVLTNLLTNAHLYTPEGGSLGVTVRAVRHTITVAVSDTGRGMSPEDVEHVFERFFRAGGEDGQGTGLGLAIVRSLVDLHGGRVDVQSALGKGTTFTVVLPLAAETAQPAAARRALVGKRVLVVEDEATIADLVSSRLRELGVHPEIAPDGQVALERLRTGRYDAMTLDILMPGMSGMEVLRTVRADETLASLAVVVVSVFSGREALSGEWVVGKPIDPEELADTLGAAVLASRVRVLIAARESLRPRLAGALSGLGLEHDWVGSAEEAAACCAAHFYEVGVVESGLPDVAEAVAAMDLRGRRNVRTVLLADADVEPPALPPGAAQPVSIDDIGAVIVGLLDPSAARGRASLGTFDGARAGRVD